jgi:hypothetical protein
MPGRVAYRLSAALAVVAALAGGLTVVMPDLLRGPAAMNGSARGTALIVLVAAVPILVAGMVATARGSARALVAWLAAAAYLLYNAVMLLLGTPANHLFLLYVAMLSLALWSLVAVLRGVDVAAFGSRFGPGAPVRAVAVYTWVVAALNALAWLKGAVPGSFEDGQPSYLDGTGLTTLPTYVQDLAFWLPLLAVAAGWLWRRAAWGYLAVTALLGMLVLEAVGVAVDQWMGHAADPTSPVVSVAVVPGFVALAVVGMVPVFALLRHLDRPAGPGGAGDARAADQPAAVFKVE